MMLIRKSLHTLTGVLADLGSDAAQVDNVLLAEYLARLAAEWPKRWLAPPGSRAFATHLSNIDLHAMMLSLPLTVARWWLAESHELLSAFPPSAARL